jgi:hypothetical protein
MAVGHVWSAAAPSLTDETQQRIVVGLLSPKQKIKCAANQLPLGLAPPCRERFQAPVLVLRQQNLDACHHVV